MIEEKSIYKNYQIIGRTLNSVIRTKKRALITRIQADYNITAPGIAIQKQLNGELSGNDNNVKNDNDDASEIIIASLKFIERRRLAEASLYNPSIFIIEKDYR
jgi:hypothetical protein